jgi:hypothetical protein
MPPCASLAEDFPEVGLPGMRAPLMALVGRERRKLSAAVQAANHLSTPLDDVVFVAELLGERFRTLFSVFPVVGGCDVAVDLGVDLVERFLVNDFNHGLDDLRELVDEIEAIPSDGRCFFGAGGRGFHCVWSWTQARPGVSGRAPFPSVGICGPLSPVSVILLYSATTINILEVQE